MQIVTTVRLPFIAVRMVVIKRVINNKRWRRRGEKGTLVRCLEECKHGLHGSMENHVEDAQKIKKQNYCMIQQFHSWLFIVVVVVVLELISQVRLL